MIFGPTDVAEAEGAILAHSLAAGSMRLKKGRRLTATDIRALLEAGVSRVIAARVSDNELVEDSAAERVGAAFPISGIDRKSAATGRVNFHAAADGVFTIDRATVDAVNRLDPAITFASLPEYATVARGQMVATVKIIPFAAAASSVAAVEAIAGKGSGMTVHPFRPLRTALIQTLLPGVKAGVLDKTARTLAARLARSGGDLVGEARTAHDADHVAAEIVKAGGGADLIVLFGASAVSDPDDVIPAAIRLAGGAVERVGMPVDPGNLLVLGRLGATPVLGAPGCARSPKENGFDWVLDRLAARVPVTGDHIAGMGVGGLLMEIPTRPQPRETEDTASWDHPVAIVILAAGKSTRMGGPNKLLALFDGEPLVRLVADRALEARSAGVVVVVGHQTERIHIALGGLPVEFADNPDYASGLASSLKAGLRAVPDHAGGALVMLADMPRITTADLNRMIVAFHQSGGRAVVRAADSGKRGNPVILPRVLFPEIMKLEGDSGARAVIEAHAEIVDVELGAAAFVDVDTEEAMLAAGGSLDG